VNPDTQAYFAMKPEVAVTGDFPTLDELRDCYGEQFASAWLVPQIYDMSAFTGARNLTEKQQEQLADILAVECRSLKVTELMLFFYRFKTGRYGRFYGAVDPMVVTTALQDFLRERDELRDRCADEAAAKWDTEARSRWEQVLKAVAERLPRLQAGTDIYIFTTEPHSHRLLASIGNSEAERYITAPQQWQVWEQIAAHYFPPDFGTLVLRRGYTPEASSTEPAHPPEGKK
jgi:hypothetical protein